MRMRWTMIWVALAVAAGACGDDDATETDGGGGGEVDGSTPVRDGGMLPDGRVLDGGRTDSGGGGTCSDDPTGDGTLDGTRVAWHPLELSLTGPTADETGDAPNPFLDYRLEVTFTGPSGQEYVVPGYFDGDGEGGASGDVWRARFSPDEGGDWTWTATFREGEDVALDLDATGGTAGSLDGASGAFCVEARDPAAPGFLAHGRLDYVGGHYLQLADGTWWIKGGADSPENFLGYAGFDNTVDQSGGAGTSGLTDGVHRYEPHVDDWNEGDPDWNDGAGKGIIGALNYLASEEVNSIYFLPCNLGGDGRETYPYVEPDDQLHIDLSKVAQWEIVFRHAQRLGIALHFVLNETEAGNENLHDDGTLGTERKLYYRELSARFGHHLALFWNIGEENDYGSARQIEFAGYIDAVDAYDHPTTVHTHVNDPAGQYDGLVGNEHFDMTSIQMAPDRADQYTETWRTESADAGRPWVIMLDEISPAGTGVTDTNAPEIREKTLWPAYLSGSGGVEWYFGYHDLPLGGDMRTEDFRTREEMWRYTRIARHFVEDNLPFTEMEPMDDLLTGEAGSGEVFAKPCEVYALYLPDGSDTGTLDLSAVSGDLRKRWLDPRTGEFVGDAETVTATAALDLGSPPSDPTEDWVLLLDEGPTCE